MGKIYNNNFEIMTYPDNLTLTNFSLFKAPVLMYGTIDEVDNKTIVQYKMRRTYIAYVIAGFFLVLDSSWFLGELLSRTEEYVLPFILFHMIAASILIIMLIKIPHSEEEELHKLMEDLKTID